MRIIIFSVLVAMILTFVPAVYSQETELGEDVEKSDVMPEKMHHMMQNMHKMHKEKMGVTPEQVAGFDDETKDAWREIEQIKIKRKTNIYLAFATALVIGIAVVGGVLAQGKVAASAMEGIARNPEAGAKIFTPLIISLALIESLVIYALVIAFILQGKM